MKRLFKILLGLVGLIVILLVVTAVLLPVIYDKEDLKAAIAGEVKRQTGRDLTINGDLGFSVFPWLAVEVGDLTLSNAQGFPDLPFAQVSQARAGVALVPLFSKQISVDEITLDGLNLRLMVDANGRNNWEDLDGSEQAVSTGDAQSGSEPGMFAGKRVAGLNVTNATVEFEDLQAGSHYRLKDFSMQTGALGEPEPVAVEVRALLEDVKAANTADFVLKTVALIDLENERYAFEDLGLALALQAAKARHSLLLQAPQLVIDMNQQSLQMDAFTLEVADLQVDGSLTATGFPDNSKFSGALESGNFSPRELMEAIGIEAPVTKDPGVLGKAQFSTQLSGSDTHLSFSGLSLLLDDSQIEGEVNVQNFDRPKVVFDFFVDQMDLERYMESATEPVEAVNASTDAGESGTRPGQEVVIPQQELQGMELQGQLRAGVLLAGGVTLSDAKVGVNLVNGRLRLNPLTAGFYGGRYNGDIVLDGSGSVPTLSVNEKIESIAFQQLVADIVESGSLSGTANGHARLTGRGKTSTELLGSLQGDLGLFLTEGALEGINIWYEIRRGVALYKGLPAPEPEPNRTVFSKMTLAGAVDGGVLNTRELIAELPFLTISGNGSVDFGRSDMNLGLVAVVRSVPDLDKDPLGSELKGKSLPLKVTGPIGAPAVSVDWEALLASEAADALIDKLGLKPKETTEGEPGEPESSSDQLEKAAKGALFDLLRKKDKKKDKEDNNE